MYLGKKRVEIKSCFAPTGKFKWTKKKTKTIDTITIDSSIDSNIRIFDIVKAMKIGKWKTKNIEMLSSKSNDKSK